MEAPLITPVAGRVHAPKSKPDARPMRLALGAGGIAALSALATAIVMPPGVTTATVVAPPQGAGDPGAVPTSVQAQRPVRYVQLSPGQTAPPGATVIEPNAPTPITVVVTVTAPPQNAAKPIIIKTTQSGKVVP
jgi:hypothetical protein